MARISITESQIRKDIEQALEASPAPDDGYWTSKELQQLLGISRDRMNIVLEKLLESGEWERAWVTRMSVVSGHGHGMSGFRPKAKKQAE